MEIESADSIIANSSVEATLEIIDISQLVAGLGGMRVLVHSEANIMPFGNAIVLSLAVTYAVQMRAKSILIGIHADDAKENAEYNREFFDTLEGLARKTRGDISILTPFIEMGKADVFKLGDELGVAYEETWSCIRPGDIQCGYCGACRARSRAMASIGRTDTTKYERPVVALRSVAAH